MREIKPNDHGRWQGSTLSHLLVTRLLALRSRALTVFRRHNGLEAVYSFPELGAVETQNISGELHGIVSVLNAGRKKTLVNSFLRGWAGWWNWILAGLILAAALIPNLRGASISAAVLILIGSVSVAGWTWWMRPFPDLTWLAGWILPLVSRIGFPRRSISVGPLVQVE